MGNISFPLSRDFCLGPHPIGANDVNDLHWISTKDCVFPLPVLYRRRSTFRMFTIFRPSDLWLYMDNATETLGINETEL